MSLLKAILGLLLAAVAGTGTYLTYDHLSKEGNSKNEEKQKEECVKVQETCFTENAESPNTGSSSVCTTAALKTCAR